jgi:signal transduction histidine kinase
LTHGQCHFFGRKRRFLKTLDISRRVLFVALVPAAIIGLTLALYLIALRYNDADITLMGRGAALARQLAPAAEYGAFSGNIAELRRLAGSVRNEADVTAVAFHSREGILLASVGSLKLAENVRYLPDGWQGSTPDGETLFFHAKIHRASPDFEDPFAQGKTNEAGVTAEKIPEALLGSVTVEMSRSAVVASKQKTLVVTILIFLAALLVGTLLGRRLSRDVTEPIIALQKTVLQIHDGKLDVRVPQHPAGTLHILEEGINEMATALLAGRDHLEARIADATRELREKKDEAERTNLAKSRFLAAASHDLRQPLHALSLFTSELERQPNSLSQRRLLKHIGSAVDALNLQFKALLDISRFDLGDIVVRKETLALSPLIGRVVDVHAPDASEKFLRLRHVSSRLWTTSDPLLLERMLSNLLANAVRYTNKGGIVVGVRQRGDELSLDVADSGIGIGEEQLPLIFQEFYQVGNPERDAEKGLGLGLSIVTRMAKILGHRIEVRSRPGRGSVFSIVLPCAMPIYQAESLPEQETAGLFGFSIDVLLFFRIGEDRANVCDLLESWGCRIECADNYSGYDEDIITRPTLVICDASHVAVANGFVSSFEAEPPLLIVLGEASGQVPSAHVLALPLRPARLRALLQQLLHGTDGDEDDQDACRVRQATRLRSPVG